MISDILKKPLWDLKDIQEYTGCCQSKASMIMQAAKRISVSRYLPSKAKRDNVLEVLGLDYEDEVKKLKLLQGEK